MCKLQKNISPFIHTYDTDGQFTQKLTSEGITTYSYTTQGTLTKVVTPTNIIEYILNPLGQRIAKKVGGTITEKYLWADLTTLLATLDANNNIIQRYNYTDSRVPTSMQQDGETYYLHYDQVGTLKAISDTNHNIVKEITYDTYGNIQEDSNPNFKIPFGFAGGLQDRDTNLVHFGYRELDTYTGKWTTKDPIDFNGGDSNLYGYVLQDPVNFVDPEGLQKYSIGKPESHNGGKSHVHWGPKNNSRANAVNADGSVRHGQTAPSKVKDMINDKYKWNLKTPLINLTPFDTYEEFEEWQLCGENGCCL